MQLMQTSVWQKSRLSDLQLVRWEQCSHFIRTEEGTSMMFTSACQARFRLLCHGHVCQVLSRHNVGHCTLQLSEWCGVFKVPVRSEKHWGGGIIIVLHLVWMLTLQSENNLMVNWTPSLQQTFTQEEVTEGELNSRTIVNKQVTLGQNEAAHGGTSCSHGDSSISWWKPFFFHCVLLTSACCCCS